MQRPSPMSIGAQRTSSLRFCERRYHERITDERGRVVSEGEACQRYRLDRPFNGRRIKARLHPACGQWERGSDGVLTCSHWVSQPCRLEDGVPDSVPAAETIRTGRFDPERTAAFGVICL